MQEVASRHTDSYFSSKAFREFQANFPVPTPVVPAPGKQALKKPPAAAGGGLAKHVGRDMGRGNGTDELVLGRGKGTDELVLGREPADKPSDHVAVARSTVTRAGAGAEGTIPLFAVCCAACVWLLLRWRRLKQ